MFCGWEYTIYSNHIWWKSLLFSEKDSFLDLRAAVVKEMSERDVTDGSGRSSDHRCTWGACYEIEVCSSVSSEKTLMLGKIEWKSRRGQQGMRLLDSVTDSVDVSLSELWDIVKDGEVWYLTAVHGDTKSWTQLSNWTTTSVSRGLFYQYSRRV